MTVRAILPVGDRVKVRHQPGDVIPHVRSTRAAPRHHRVSRPTPGPARGAVSVFDPRRRDRLHPPAMEPIMETTVERCAGLDIHQASVVACVLVGPPGCKPRKEVRSFGTSTRELEALRAWLEELGVTHVGMESTGVYWKPVHAVLEGRFELIVGNAHHIKAVPGRKTDVKDAEWLADLVRHGLIRPSFVPPPPIRELRDLVRLRRSLTEARSTERNRTLKLLETANIKLASVASEVFGVSGMAMLRALVEGEAAPAEMAEAGAGQAAPQAGAADAGPGGPPDRAPPLRPGLPPAAAGGDRRRPARARHADRGQGGAVPGAATAAAADPGRRRAGRGHAHRRGRGRH